MQGQVDFAAWVSRAREFMVAIDGRPGVVVGGCDDSPPLSREETGALSRIIGRNLPSTFRALLQTGAGALECRYTLEYDPDDETATELFLTLFPHQTSIYGGPTFGPAQALPDFARSCAEWAEQFDASGDAAEADRWRTAVPIIAVLNGDYVALDGSPPAADADDPPVIYLSHEGESTRLARSFTTFLTVWERLCYLGPEIWLLDQFRGADGLLTSATSATDQLRQLLGVPALPPPPVA